MTSSQCPTPHRGEAGFDWAQWRNSLAHLAGAVTVDIHAATRRARSFKEDGRLCEAIALYRSVAEAFPRSAVARHNLAAALGDAGRWAEADASLQEAMQLGLDAAETWLVLARCRQAQGAFDEAARCFRQTLKRDPDNGAAIREFAQFNWMRTGDVSAALADIEARLRSRPTLDIRLIKALVLREVGHGMQAFELLKDLASAHDDARIHEALSQSALLELKPNIALAHAERALSVCANSVTASVALMEALLALGRYKEAADIGDRFCERAPFNQHAIALRAAAWRLLDDPRYEELYDYESLLCVTRLDTPKGWTSLGSYLNEVTTELKRVHRYRTHPFAQSIRSGSQVPNVNALAHPATQALPDAIRAPVEEYLNRLGQGRDPLRVRNRGRYELAGMWSIRMQAGGRHIDHVHPQGWLSSASYLEMPADCEDSEGAIVFGAARFGALALKAERVVLPAPGMLLLFPSYMWHGTLPFSGAGDRLTFAFDLSPARTARGAIA